MRPGFISVPSKLKTRHQRISAQQHVKNTTIQSAKYRMIIEYKWKMLF